MKTKDFIYLAIIAALVLFIIIYWNKPISAKVNMSLSDILRPGGWSMLLEKLKIKGKIFGWEIGLD